MTDDPNIPPEVAQEMEAELRESAEAATAPDPGPSASTWTGPTLAPAVTPLADLRARLAMLKEADVEVYEDGPLRLKFDVEGRRMVRVQREAPSEEPKW